MLSFIGYLAEGNPLARVHAHAEEGRHFVALSAERSNLSKKENEGRMNELKGKLKAQGYGYKKAEGKWEGGKENSLIVHAKGPGQGHGNNLVKDMKQHAAHYGQDAILHHNGHHGTLVGTNDSGYPGKNKTASVGKIKANQPSAPFQTELRPSKTKSSASFTTV